LRNAGGAGLFSYADRFSVACGANYAVNFVRDLPPAVYDLVTGATPVRVGLDRSERGVMMQKAKALAMSVIAALAVLGLGTCPPILFRVSAVTTRRKSIGGIKALLTEHPPLSARHGARAVLAAGRSWSATVERRSR
jgi:hypothetical protein